MVTLGVSSSYLTANSLKKRFRDLKITETRHSMKIVVDKNRIFKYKPDIKCTLHIRLLLVGFRPSLRIAAAHRAFRLGSQRKR